jgi:hypothetical protein
MGKWVAKADSMQEACGILFEMCEIGGVARPAGSNTAYASGVE